MLYKNIVEADMKRIDELFEMTKEQFESEDDFEEVLEALAYTPTSFRNQLANQLK